MPAQRILVREILPGELLTDNHFVRAVEPVLACKKASAQQRDLERAEISGIGATNQRPRSFSTCLYRWLPCNGENVVLTVSPTGQRFAQSYGLYTRHGPYPIEECFVEGDYFVRSVVFL